MQIQTPNVKRVNWQLGVILDLYRGGDGHVRTVSLRTSRGLVTNRPIQKLYPLELSEDATEPNQIVSQEPLRRSARLIAKRLLKK